MSERVSGAGGAASRFWLRATALPDAEEGSAELLGEDKVRRLRLHLEELADAVALSVAKRGG